MEPPQRGSPVSPAAEIASLERRAAELLRRAARLRAGAAAAARQAVCGAAERSLARLMAAGASAAQQGAQPVAAPSSAARPPRCRPSSSLPERVRREVADARQGGQLGGIHVVVPRPERRGLRAGQLLDFFRGYCGDVAEEGGEAPLPVCKATKLAEHCLLMNRAQREDIAAGRAHRAAPNLYAVNDLFIKPHTAQRRISYAELLNPAGCLIDYFISHYWGEDFGEFTQSVLRHALSEARNLAVRHADVAYWCCAFANNQHRVELGETLEQSPFYKALTSETCRGTILNLDCMASAFTRIWCVYEVHLTHLIRKPLVVNTSEGPLNVELNQAEGGAGLKSAFVVHMNSLLQYIDVEEAESSNAEDRHKILQSVAGFRGEDFCAGLTGAEALNATIKRLVSGQAIFVLARLGDAAAMRTALRNGAPADAADARGLRPLTYAAGHHGSESPVAQLLLDAGATPMAQVGAAELLGLWDSGAERRALALAATRHWPPEVLEFHAPALVAAREDQHRRQLAELLQNLSSTDATLRAAAIAALAELGEAAAPLAAEVAARLADPVAAVRQAAIRALPQLGREVAAARAGELAAALNDPADRVRGAAMAVLPLLGAAGAEALLVWLRGGAHRGGLAAVQVLPRLGSVSTELVAALAARVEDEDICIRQAAIEALSRLGEAARPYAQTLARQLAHESACIRCAAARALPALGAAAEPHLPQLAALLDDEDSRVRRAVVAALAQLGAVALGPSFLGRLAERLRDQHAGVRVATANALGRLGPAAAGYAAALVERMEGDADAGPRQAALEALLRLGAVAVEPHAHALAAQLAAAGPKARALAAEALRLLPPEVAGEAVALQLERPEVHARVAAVATLLERGPRAAGPHLEALLRCLHDSDWHVRAAAAGLAELGAELLGARHVGALAPLLQDETWQVRAAAARVLPRVGALAEPLLPRFAELVEDSGPDVRAAALQALATLSGEEPGAGAALSASHAGLAAARLGDKHARVRAAAAQALARAPLEAALPHLPALRRIAAGDGKDEDARAAQEALRALLGGQAEAQRQAEEPLRAERHKCAAPPEN